MCFYVDLLLRGKEHDRIIVGNDPVNFIDPEGLFAADAARLGGGLMVTPIPGARVVGAVVLSTAAIVAGVDAYNHYAKKSGKEKASDIPSWAKGQKPRPGESGKDFADRLLKDKYGDGCYPKGPGSEHNKIKKYGDRSR